MYKSEQFSDIDQLLNWLNTRIVDIIVVGITQAMYNNGVYNEWTVIYKNK